MASVLNRTTKQYLPSVSTPEYPAEEWIHNPDLSAVEGYDARYWAINGDAVSLMSEAERNAVDTAAVTAARDAAAEQLKRQEDILRAFMLLVLEEFNGHASKLNAILDAADSATNLATFKSAMAAISDYPQRTEQQLRTAIRNKLGS